MMDHLRRASSSFLAAQQGAVAVLAALMLIPLVAGAGVATDYSREAIMKASLQSIADSAAIAGASELNQTNGSALGITLATNYFNKSVAKIANSASVSSPVVTSPNSITVTVTASATLKTTLLGIFEPTMTINVLATAQGPGYAIKATQTGGFSAQAGDGNSIYYYKIPPGGGIPTTLSSYTLLFTNNPLIDPNWAADNATPKTIALGPNDQVGFALYNQTGARSAYGSNAYGGTLGSTHAFFSNLSPTSNLPGYGYTSQGTYYTGTTNANGSCTKTAITTTVNNYVPTATSSCNAHPCTTLVGGGVYNNNLLVNGACSTATTAASTCLQLYNNPTQYAWNDMGGSPDDFDYNDAVYTVNCVPNMGTNTASGTRAVILTQ